MVTPSIQAKSSHFRALAPRLYEARSAPSWVAIGTTYSRFAYSPLTCPSTQYHTIQICLKFVLPRYFKASTCQSCHHSGSLEQKECSKCQLCSVSLASALARLQGPDHADWVLHGAHIILCVVPGTAVSAEKK